MIVLVIAIDAIVSVIVVVVIIVIGVLDLGRRGTPTTMLEGKIAAWRFEVHGLCVVRFLMASVTTFRSAMSKPCMKECA